MTFRKQLEDIKTDLQYEMPHASADAVKKIDALLDALSQHFIVPNDPTREMWAAMADAVVGKTSVHHDIVVRDAFTALRRACTVIATEGNSNG